MEGALEKLGSVRRWLGWEEPNPRGVETWLPSLLGIVPWVDRSVSRAIGGSGGAVEMCGRVEGCMGACISPHSGILGVSTIHSPLIVLVRRTSLCRAESEAPMSPLVPLLLRKMREASGVTHTAGRWRSGLGSRS